MPLSSVESLLASGRSVSDLMQEVSDIVDSASVRSQDPEVIHAFDSLWKDALQRFNPQ